MIWYRSVLLAISMAALLVAGLVMPTIAQPDTSGEVVYTDRGPGAGSGARR